ncbi:hypothetical protein [Streptomyces nogalater]|uniref:Secreted protein n=1 Tax=Streptomyces nogalater TaxID=38314 RepID=A0ABW0WK67_STRNO
MKFKGALVCAFATLAAAGGAAGTVHAAGGDTHSFDNGGQILSCDVIEVLDQPNVNPADNNIDCSANVKKEEVASVHLVFEALPVDCERG